MSVMYQHKVCNCEVEAPLEAFIFKNNNKTADLYHLSKSKNGIDCNSALWTNINKIIPCE